MKFTRDNQECISYLCIPSLGNRTFLPQKAKAIKGLVPSKHYKLLTDGQTVTLDDGTQVTSEMVCAPPAPRQCFAFMFMPDAGYLPSFLETFNDSPFAKLFEANIDAVENKMVTVYHSVPKEVMLNDQYR